MLTRVKTPAEIEAMRASGRILATILQELKQASKPGVSTKQLADLASQRLKDMNAKPVFLGYDGFPDILCVSLNDEVVHGIPKANRILADGDLVSLDFGVNIGGMITDGAISFVLGEASPKVARLLKTTEESMLAGINALHDGVRVGDISREIEKVLNRDGFGIVRDLVGHGVGHELHEDPNIPNYGHAGTGMVLKEGMTIAIEPMATLGDYHVQLEPDHWTVRTIDGSLAAHFEHTVLITAKGAEILTQA